MGDDPAEPRNVAAEHPDRLRELIELWWAEAEKYKVLPLDGSLQARLATERPQTSKPRKQFVYYPGGSVVPAFAAPPLLNRPHSIEADAEIANGDTAATTSAHLRRTDTSRRSRSTACSTVSRSTCPES